MCASRAKNDKIFLGAGIVAIIICAFLLSVAMASLPSLPLLMTDRDGEIGDGSGDGSGEGDAGEGDGTGDGSSDSGDGSGDGEGTGDGGEGEGEGGTGEGDNSGGSCCGTGSCSICTQGGVPGNELVLEIFGVTKTGYLRTTAAGLYEVSQWTMGSDDEVVGYGGEYLSQDLALFSSREESSVSVKVANQLSGFVPTIFHTNSLVLENVDLEYYPSQQIFYAVDSFTGTYPVVFTHFEFSSELLENAQVAPQASDSIYLQIPDSLRSKVQSLLDQIGIQSYSSSYSKIVAIRNFLTTNYTYDVSYTVAPAGRDPVEWFLFTEKRGVCANFNSAFVVLLRAAGVPSRMVGGFGIDGSADYQEVRAWQAHAWAEVEFDKLGWVEFDATAQGFLPVPEEESLIETFTSITSMEPSAVKGGFFTVSGEVTAVNGAKPSGLQVIISMMENKDETGLVCGETRVSNGHFSIQCNVSTSINVGHYNIVAKTLAGNGFAGSDSDPILKVNSETALSATSQNGVVNKPVLLKAKLTEKVTQAPLMNSQISMEYTVSGQQKTQTSQTNASGYAVFTFQAPANSENISYTVKYNGAEYYLASTANGVIIVQGVEEPQIEPDTEIDDQNPAFYNSALLYASIPIAIAVAGSVIYLVKRQKKMPELVKSVDKNQCVPIIQPKEKVADLEITFPQIREPLPRVWGLNESLKINFGIRQKADHKNGMLKLEITELEPQTLILADDKPASISVTLRQKGVHKISASLSCEQNEGVCQGGSDVRIVDYTEEIVDIYNETFNYVKELGFRIGEENTPREFQSIVQENAKSVDKASLERLVSLFEIADYSLMLLQRRHYEEMFLASLSIKTTTTKKDAEK